MTAELERLINNAQTSMQDEESDRGGAEDHNEASEGRVTQSKGVKFTWNPEMSSKLQNVLVSTESDNVNDDNSVSNN